MSGCKSCGLEAEPINSSMAEQLSKKQRRLEDKLSTSKEAVRPVFPLGIQMISPFFLSDNIPNAVWIWDIQKLKLFVVLEQLCAIQSFQWDPRQPRLALCTGNSKVYLWSPAGCVSVQVPTEGKEGTVPSASCHELFISTYNNAGAKLSTGLALAYGSLKTGLSVFQKKTADYLCWSPLHSNKIRCPV